MPRVLVVDDEPHVREFLRRALSQWGHEVVEAENGGAALVQYQLARPDIILLDVAMPVMNGFQALEKLRASPLSQATPVILVTTHPASEGEPLGMSLGCQHYISKPFDLDVLEATIRVALRESRALHQDQPDRRENPDPPAAPRAGVSPPPPAATPEAAVLRTGIELVDVELGGGISPQSLTLIEGTSGVGKSVFCRHLAHQTLLNQQKVLYISPDDSQQSLVASMSSLGLTASQYLEKGRLQTCCFNDPGLDDGSAGNLPALLQMVQDAPGDPNLILIDAVTNRSIYGQEADVVRLFELCQGQCARGRTICVVTHSAVLEEKLWLALRTLLDTHIRLSLKPMGRTLVKTLEVLKLNNAEVHTGHRIAFDVQPGTGMVPTRISDATA